MQTRVLSKVRVGAGESGSSRWIRGKLLSRQGAHARLKGKLPTIMRILPGGALGWKEREDINRRRGRTLTGVEGGH